MAHGDFKDLPRRTTFDKVLRDKAFNNAENPKYDGYQRSLTSMVYTFFDKKSSGADTSVGAIKSKIMPNHQLAEDLHKPIIRKSENRKVYLSFKENIWGAYLVDMQLISKCNKGICLSLSVIHIFSKYAWVAPLKDEKRYYNLQHFSKNFKRV